MNLEDVIDPEYGLQQDERSLTRPKFGSEGQLEVVGWSEKPRTNKHYILKCGTCSQDSELFGEGYFKSLKMSLVRGQLPCGCSKTPKWSKDQYKVLCSRKAQELGYTFLGFTAEWKGGHTKTRTVCEEHGEWSTGTINRLINRCNGCPECQADALVSVRTKSNDVMIKSFFASGSFPPDTEFWKSDRKNKSGHKIYWCTYCPECKEIAESSSSRLQKGHRPCMCSIHRQKEAYINLLFDANDLAVAIKFGISRDSNHRIKKQNSDSAYNLKQHSVYTFMTVRSCKQAERECKKELECEVVLKRDMLDGYTETTWVYNLEKIIEIYERNGGIRND